MKNYFDDATQTIVAGMRAGQVQLGNLLWLGS